MDENRQLMGLRRGLEILEHLGRKRDGCAFGEIREALNGLAATTVSRVLKTLQDAGWVEKDAVSRRWGLANRTRQLGRIITGGVPRGELLRPLVERLAQETQESASYWEPEEDAMVLLVKVEQEQSMHYRPLHSRNEHMTTNGFGQMCLAWADRRVWRTAFRREAALNLNQEAFGKRLLTIRQERFFLERGETSPDWFRAVAPVFQGSNGLFVGAIGIAYPCRLGDSIPEESFTEAVMRTARTATEWVGQNAGPIAEGMEQ